MSFLSSLMNALPGAAAQGLAWGIMAIGVYITFRILDVADLTVDGSLATGGCRGLRLLVRHARRPHEAIGTVDEVAGASNERRDISSSHVSSFSPLVLPKCSARV